MNSSYKEYASKEYVEQTHTWESLPDKPFSIEVEPSTFFNITQSLSQADGDTAAALLNMRTYILNNPPRNIEVIYDGVSYICKTVETDFFYAMGNLSLFERVAAKPQGYDPAAWPNEWPDTGEPFLLIYLRDWRWICYYSETAGDHSFDINLLNETVHTLDPVYLPPHEFGQWKEIRNQKFSTTSAVEIKFYPMDFEKYNDFLIWINLRPTDSSSEDIAHAPKIQLAYQYSETGGYPYEVTEPYTPKDLSLLPSSLLVLKLRRYNTPGGDRSYICSEIYRSGGKSPMIYSGTYAANSPRSYDFKFSAYDGVYEWQSGSYTVLAKQ